MVRFVSRYSWNYNWCIMKIATHDSATGERSKNLLHSLGKIFAQTQNKTIKEQYEAGVRYFDFRVDKDLILCHGLWKSNKTLQDILAEMKSYVQEIVYIRVVIERKYSEEVYQDLQNKIRKIVNLYDNYVNLTYIAKKLPWEVIKKYEDVVCTYQFLSVPTFKEYINLTHKDWKRYIPIPWILKKVTPEVRFNNDYFIMVDFI